MARKTNNGVGIERETYNMKKNIYISPPFGNYISHRNCISVKGTYTWDKRSGLIKQIIKTLRPVPGGWSNAIGFRNPGLRNINNYDKTSIYSIAAIDSNWTPFIQNIPNWVKIEINTGCPNVGLYTIKDKEIKQFTGQFVNISAKLNPKVELDYIKKLYDLGIRIFHLSNTIPTDKGGISGKPLKKVNLPLVEKVSNLLLPNSTIIAGGGIYTPQDVIDLKQLKSAVIKALWIIFPTLLTTVGYIIFG